MSNQQIINGCVVTTLSPGERADFWPCKRRYHVKYPYAEVDSNNQTGCYVNSMKDAIKATKEKREMTTDKKLIEFGWGTQP